MNVPNNRTTDSLSPAIQRWDEETIELDLNPHETTIADLKTTIIDQFQTSRSERGVRVLRNSLPISAVSLELNGHKLEEDKTFSECRVEADTILKATHADRRTTRKRYGKGFDDDADMEQKQRLEKQRRREERRKEKSKGKESDQKREEAEEMVELPRQQKEVEPDAGIETENKSEPQQDNIEECQYEDQAGEREAFLVVEEDLNVSISENFQIRPEREVAWLEIELDDPAQEVDADKENWDPQILRELAADGIPVRR